MIIFYGFKTFRKEVLESKEQNCTACDQKTTVKLIRDRRWFQLFWIPVFPVSVKYFHLCESCNSMTEVSKQQATAELKEAK